MKKLLVFFTALALTLSATTQAAEDKINAKSLSELLQMVKEGKLINRDVNNQRE
jgi:hypothetical protein